jgi:transcription initiation factor IIF auxiliary subunit
MALHRHIAVDAGDVESGERMTISIKQDAHRETKTWWEWSIWLDGPPEEMAEVAKVVYTLHPSFVDPVHEIKTRSNGFKLKSMGWGEFHVHLEIHTKDGKVKKRKHWLTLTETAANAKQKKTVSRSAKEVVEKAARSTESMMKAARMPVESFESQPALFISGSVADMQAIRNITQQLQSQGTEVFSTLNLPVSSVPWERQVHDALNKSRAAMFVVSEEPSRTMMQEIDIAKAAGVQVIPVVVGKNVKVPSALDQFKSIRFSGLDDLKSAGLDLAALGIKL